MKALYFIHNEDDLISADEKNKENTNIKNYYD